LRAGRAGTGEGLRKAERLVGREVGIAIKCVRPAEKAGEEIVDLLPDDVGAHFVAVASAHMRQALGPLVGLGIGETRAEVIPPETERRGAIRARETQNLEWKLPKFRRKIRLPVHT
jgi:hypothetical protein